MQREWQGSRRHQIVADDEKNAQVDASLGGANGMLAEHKKGILGPGPADQRFSDFL